MAPNGSEGAGRAPLNPYAERVARRLAERFPEHADEMAVDDEGDLWLEIDCPSYSVEAGLWIGTWNEDVIVGFHTHHAHFSDWERSGTDDHIETAIDAARDVLAERLVVVSRYTRVPLRGSGWLAGSTYWDRPEGALAERRRSERSIRSRLGLREVTLRSWDGSYDAGLLPTGG